MHPLRMVKVLALLLLSVFVFSCGGSGSGGDGGTGTLSLSMTDAASQDYKAVYVTIEEVSVHRDRDGWQRVGSPEKTFNLLELVNGVRVELALTELSSGHYSQMRLKLRDTPDDVVNILSQPHPYANYLIDDSDVPRELKVPSGLQTGIKIVKGFDIAVDGRTELILDFDASRSVVIAGSSGKWLLKPTIKLGDLVEAWTLSGTVYEEDPVVLAGGLVSAQTFDPSASDASAELVVETSTLSGEEGNYALFLSPASYNIVAYAEGYGPACARVDSFSETEVPIDFILGPSVTPGDVIGTALIGSCNGSVDETDTRHVALSFRQEADCDGGGDLESIEVRSLNVGNGGKYSVALPPGRYDLVASTYGQDPLVISNVDVLAGGSIPLDVCIPSD